MTKKSGLGKGLDALFGPVPEEEKQQGTNKLTKYFGIENDIYTKTKEKFLIKRH